MVKSKTLSIEIPNGTYHKSSITKGIEAHKAGNVHEAEQYYSHPKSEPEHPDANHNMGVGCRTWKSRSRTTIL